VLGAVLGGLGLMTGGSPDNDKEREEWQILGKKPYSVYIPPFGWVSINWLRPFVGAMLLGRDVQEIMTNDDSAFDKFAQYGSSAFTSLFTDSPLDVQALKYAKMGVNQNDKGYEAKVGMKLGLNWALQFIPRATKALGKTIDPYERDAYSKDTAIALRNSIMLAVPGASYKLPPKFDIWGQPIKASSYDGALGFVDRFVKNFISPFKATPAQMDTTTKEVQRVFDATKKETTEALPSVIASKFYYDKVEYEMSGKDYEQAQKRVGELSKQNIEVYMKRAQYNNLTDLQKAKAFAKIYENARETAKREYRLSLNK
jgi:hypothetical protein